LLFGKPSKGEKTMNYRKRYDSSLRSLTLIVVIGVLGSFIFHLIRISNAKGKDKLPAECPTLSVLEQIKEKRGEYWDLVGLVITLGEKRLTNLRKVYSGHNFLEQISPAKSPAYLWKRFRSDRRNMKDQFEDAVFTYNQLFLQENELSKVEMNDDDLSHTFWLQQVDFIKREKKLWEEIEALEKELNPPPLPEGKESVPSLKKKLNKRPKVTRLWASFN
jgi:hypothetical protein